MAAPSLRRASSGSFRRLAPRRRWRRYPWYTFYLFLAPWLIVGFLTFTLAPMIINFVVSFTDWDGFPGTHVHWWILDNYKNAWNDPQWTNGVIQSLKFTLVTVVAGVAGSLGLAVFLNQPHRGVKFFRAIYYLPCVVSIVVAGAAFKMMFATNGLVNDVRMQFGGDIIQWLSGDYAFDALITMTVWQLGVGIVIFLAGLQGVSNEVLEAAWVDGSGKAQTFWRITVPLLSPVILFQVITGMIGSLQAYVQAVALSPGSLLGGGTGQGVGINIPYSNQLYMVYAFHQFNTADAFGYGAAMLEIAFVFMLVLTIFIFRLSGRFVYYESAQGGA